MKGYKSQRGATAIEFSLGVIILIYSTFAIFEASFQIYTLNMTEHALRETVRSTKVYQGNSVHEQYKEQFRTVMKRDDSLWHFLVHDEKFVFEGKYFRSYPDLVLGKEYSSEQLTFNYDLAEFTVTYSYLPKIRLFFDMGYERQISRSVVVSLEHEGW